MTMLQDPITKDFLGTGRRKASVARVRVRAGSGKITINNRDLNTFFTLDFHQQDVLAPLKATEAIDKVDIVVKVNGGGITGQSGAIKLGIARALKSFNEEYEPILREKHLLTRDSRQVERKKPGQRGARRSFQFSKR